MARPIISLIAALDEDFGIGKDNQLLCYLPADLQHFKKSTLGKPIVMGRKTFESLGKPLPGRRNIVLSRNSVSIPGVETASSVQQVLQLCTDTVEIMVIGGAQVYSQFFPVADYLLISHIKAKFNADVHFPRWQASEWEKVEQNTVPADEKNPYAFDVVIYQRLSGRDLIGLSL